MYGDTNLILGMQIHRAVRKFGKAIQTIRKERGLTLEDLAAEAGLDAAHLSRIERGEKNIALETAVRLAEGLGLDLMMGTIKLTK